MPAALSAKSASGPATKRRKPKALPRKLGVRSRTPWGKTKDAVRDAVDDMKHNPDKADEERAEREKAAKEKAEKDKAAHQQDMNRKERNVA